uniref:Uncharacterized protein n=1 Tax=Anguilla anguilla TaxID=7936 RepID=A0A0E9VDL6_ANGAN
MAQTSLHNFKLLSNCYFASCDFG